MKIGEIKKFAIENGYSDIEYLGEWKEFECYEPIFDKNEVAMTGLPYVILVDGENIRFSTNEETFEIEFE